jgi:hypothetical protein
VQGFVFLAGLELVELGLVRMTEDYRIDINLGEPRGLDQLLLRNRDQDIMEFDVTLQNLNVLYKTSVRDLDFPVEFISERMRFAIPGDFAEVNMADQFRNVLVLGVGGLKGANADTVAFAESD